ncbi:MAG: aminoacetone oxidase family FAD-binding enzyme [Oscillospiraceae bacterium]|jgi:predicted Rossmann fold flavoprotein|nr:aminoacetone oxidase family FAD-binding enzyme [Oscillospiraceae bacterium]
MRYIIIGGGAAGSFCALTAALEGHTVTLIEKNALLMKKLGITGKGRCNLTNLCDNDEFIANIFSGGNFIRSSLSKLPPTKLVDFFQDKLGFPLTVERGNRVFPQNGGAVDVVLAIKNRMIRENVRIITDTALSLIIEGNTVTGARCEHDDYIGERVVIACGGVSYPVTGSTGDGYSLARQAGHNTATPTAALVPLLTREDTSDVAELLLKNITATLFKNDKAVFKEQGEIGFETYGLSGALALTASCYIKGEANWKLRIDCKPALSEETLDARLLREIQDGAANAGDLLRKILPKGLDRLVAKRASIKRDTPTAIMTKAKRLAIVGAVKRLDFGITGKRPIEEAIVTNGGVCLDEIDPRTMKSKLVNGLYVIGETLDIAGLTGGFNLHCAFATGYAAATAD